MSQRKWTRSSLRRLAMQMKQAGYPISHVTLGKILCSLDYSLHVNSKKIEGSQHPDRDIQFQYITSQRQAYKEAGLPIISIDTKKKELVGNFKNNGREWSKEAQAVNVHDFASEGLGRAVPYGIYDTTANTGFVLVGNSADTCEFAVDAIQLWWEQEGKSRYQGASQILILADGGGSNGHRLRLWKQQVQEKLCDRLGLEVTVCHYPTGCSKWNPIEHRLFGPISSNWAGKPLRTWEMLVGYLRDTTTQTGLTVRAQLQDQVYQKGRVVEDYEMEALAWEPHTVCPAWNYTLRPRKSASDALLMAA